MEQNTKRSEITKELAKRLETYCDNVPYVLPYLAKEVSFDTETSHPIRVDYVRFMPKSSMISGIEKGDFICYEIKSSVNDFHSPNGHNFIGDYNYYVMPSSVFEKIGEEIPWKIGVLIPTTQEEKETLRVVKGSKKKERNRSAAEFLFSMLRSVLRDTTNTTD